MVDNSEQVHIIGSNGFIGKALKRSVNVDKIICWSHQSKDYFIDIYEEESWMNLLKLNPKRLILLSWPGLPNYNETFHVTKNLPQLIKLLELLIINGLKKIVVTGTCYEYGLKNGKLSEDISAEPVSQYGIAKNCLLHSLRNLCTLNSVNWCWGRIFYPFGPEQNEKSLIPSLIKAIKNNDDFFRISSGKQLRDFIHVDDVAKILIFLIENDVMNGIYNIGSGKPKSIIDFVKEIKRERNSNINIITNYYKDRKDEPQEFWADMQKLNKVYKTLK
tara:strand:+ start:6394 stop:7218 length:825 start_codon:yes stop_codon:yes gene_type:complete